MSTTCIERRVRRCVAAALAIVLAACGGGSTTETSLTGPGVGNGGSTGGVSVSAPTGPNTTQIVVDSGPSGGFSLGAANILYVSVQVCSPGSASRCVTIDHVALDTGSVGLRLLKSTVASLGLPPVTVPANPAAGTPAGPALECYQFVLGGLWGPLASADLHIAEETAASIPVQLIDDSTAPAYPAPTECVTASNNMLMASASSLQANGILGVGMLPYDCGLECSNGSYASGYTLYYACPTAASCGLAAVPSTLQVANPVTKFAVDNNGTIIVMPAVPDLGATSATGRLVFGIGTQSNNQIPSTVRVLHVDGNPASLNYLSITTTVGSTVYPGSYIDSGSNAIFFDDATIATKCQSSSGTAGSGWYCPPAILRRTATLSDTQGTSATVDFSIANADGLFSSPSVAFSDLGGTTGQAAGTFAWGLPFFYGRSVFTSIWGQWLSPFGNNNIGPWFAF